MSACFIFLITDIGEIWYFGVCIKIWLVAGNMFLVSVSILHQIFNLFYIRDTSCSRNNEGFLKGENEMFFRVAYDSG
jgi:hypothetical protein